MTKEKIKLADSISKHFVLISLFLIIISGVFVYLINRNSSTVQALADPTDFLIANNGPPLEGQWQTTDHNGHGYELWRYRNDLSATGTLHQTHTYNRYYQKIIDCTPSPYYTNPPPPAVPILVTPPPKSCVVSDDKNLSPRLNNLSRFLDDTGNAFIPTPDLGTVDDQKPFMVVGNHPKGGGGFYDPSLKLDLWVEESTTTIQLGHEDLCDSLSPHYNYDDDSSPDPETPPTDVFIIDASKNEKIIINNSSCLNPASFDLSTIGNPIDTRTFVTQINPEGIRYKQYEIEARIQNGTSKNGVNQFRLNIITPNSYLTASATKEGNDIDAINTLNISNRIPGNDHKSHVQVLWEAEIVIAPDAKNGCSYKERKHIGIYDSDYPTLAQSWMKSNRYPPRIDVYSVDRNQYHDSPNPGNFILEEQLEYDGIINNIGKSVYYHGEQGVPGTSVDSNAWEDKLYEFSGDKIYKLHIYNIDQRTWIQFRLPFSQINALAKCIRKPLVKVYYSDISAGGRFGLGDHLDACVNDDLNNGIDASVYTHGTGEIGKNAHGSSAQYGVRVHDKILGFYSNFPPSPRGKGPPTISVKELTFANTVAVWGGQFGGRGRCMSNYWRGANRLTAENIGTLDIGDNTDPLEIENNTGKLYEMNPPGLFQLTNSRPTEDLKLRVSVYVDGDLSIKNNILNTRGDLEKFNEIGYIYLIAKGNIFIDPSVTQIDAILVAYTEDNSTGGRIFTCDFDSGGINIKAKEDLDLNNPIIRDKSRDYDNACNQKLTINGALIGREIHLGRTFCEVVSPTCAIPDPDQVGEEINLSPEYFVGIPQLPEFSEWLYNSDSVTILPANF